MPLLLFILFLFTGGSIGIQAAEPEALGPVPPKPVNEPYKIYRYYNTVEKEYTGRAVYYKKIPAGVYAGYMLIYYFDRENKIYAYIETYLDEDDNPIVTNVAEYKEKYSLNINLEKSEYVIVLQEEDNDPKTYRQKTENYVMLHMLERYIVRKMPEIFQNGNTEFILFFPNLVHKSFRFSYFDFVAALAGNMDEDGTQTVDIYPDSFWIKSLLPANKKKLRVVFDPSVNDIKTVIFDNYEYRLVLP